MNPTFTGGCLCGAIRYECTAGPEQIFMFKCHCRDCQRLTGGPYAPVVYVPADTMKFMRGQVHHHFTESDAGGKHMRGFCPECGARLTGGQSASGIGVMASSLDDPSIFQPQWDAWVCDTQPWDKLNSSIPKFEKTPPAG